MAYKKNERDYYDPKYVAWRRYIRLRDGKKCQWPKCTEARSGKLHVHHIRGWTAYPHLRYDPNNGITLCRTHHSLTMGKEELFLKLFIDIVNRNNK